MITEKTAVSFAEGISRLLDDPQHGSELATRARQLAEEEYSYEAYIAKNINYRETWKDFCKDPYTGYLENPRRGGIVKKILETDS